MKKILCSFLVMLGFNLFSQEYNEYKLIEINKLQNGSSHGMIRAYEPPTEGTCPSGMIFDEKGYLYITDNAQRELNVTTSDFMFIRKENYYFSHSGIDEFIDGLYAKLSRDYIGVSIDDGKESFYINPFKRGSKLTSSTMWKMHSFFYDEDGNIYCIPDPGPDYATFDAKEAKIYKNEEVVALFEPNSGVDMKGLTIDGDYNLFDPEGNLLVRDYKRFITFWMNLHTAEKIPEPDNLFNVSWRLEDVIGLQYVGYDYRRNSYWALNHYIYVFDNEGWLIELFKFDNNKSHTRPAVHPNGDVYFLDYDEEWVYLYKTPNTWAPFDWEPPTGDSLTQRGWINSGGLRVRDNPFTTGTTVVGKLDLDTSVEILGQSADTMTIDGLTAPWYKIRTVEGLEGWVFGGYVDVE